MRDNVSLGLLNGYAGAAVLNANGLVYMLNMSRLNIPHSSIHSFANHLMLLAGQLSIFDPQTLAEVQGPTLAGNGKQQYRAYLMMTGQGNGKLLACGGYSNQCQM